MNNRMIGECKYCGQDYCMECSKHTHWEDCCCEDCHNEYMGDMKGKTDHEYNQAGQEIR